MAIDGYGNSWIDLSRQGAQFGNRFHMLKPFAAADGGKPQAFLSHGFVSMNVLKKASPDRLKELLRIMNFLAAPFGTQEDLLLQYGLQDVHYTLDGSGKLTLNDKSNVDANYVNWKYMMQHPQVMYVPDVPGFAKAEYDAEHYLVPAGVNDPTFGLFSPALGKSGATINRTMLEGITDIIASRRPFADYDQILKDWVGNGGDQIRKELADAMAAASK